MASQNGKATEATGKVAGNRPERRPSKGRAGYGEIFLGLGFAYLGGAGLEQVIDGDISIPSMLFLVAGVAGLLWILSRASVDGAIKLLSSPEIAASVMTVVMIATMLGTFILQGLSEAEFEARYGALSAIFFPLQLDDVFHSLPFSMCLALLGVTSTVIAWRRRKLFTRWRHVGRLSTHVAVVLILIGGLIGTISSQKGMVHLQVGQEAASFVANPEPDQQRGELRPLGFTIRLDAFDLDEYDLEYRFHTFAPTPDGRMEMVGSDEPTPGAEVGAPSPDDKTRIKVDRFFNHYRLERGWVADEGAAPDARPRPAARLTVKAHGDKARQAWLVGQGPQPGVWRDSHGHVEVYLTWDEPTPTFLAGLGAKGQPERHLLGLPGGAPFEVEPGKTYPLPTGGKVYVSAYLPHFVYDSKLKRAATRSNQPVNPALAVQIAPEGEDPTKAPFTYLFGKEEVRKMMMGGAHDAKSLVYQYVPGKPGVERSLVVVGSTGELVEVVGGKVASRSKATWGQPFEPSGTSHELEITLDEPIRVAREVREQIDDPDSDAPAAVEVTVTRPGLPDQQQLLVAGHARPIPLGDGRVVVFRERPDMIRNFKSTITIADQGQPGETHLLKVNDPVEHGGFALYQANYDPNNPAYSGIEVVSDPGLPLVELGMWILMLGVLHSVVLRNWRPWKRRRKTEPRVSVSDREGEEVPA